MISLRSKITRKLLSYLFLNPDLSLYLNELQKKLGLDKRNLVKKLNELEKEGVLTSETKGRLRLYSINKKYPLYEEYRNIFRKTMGIEKTLKKILTEIKGVKAAYIYGSYAANKMEEHSDIDVLVVGCHKILPLQKKIISLQKELDREINAVNIDEGEFNERLKKKDPFICGIVNGKNIKVI
jgi:predicted nucleotidyltransferase